MKEQRNDFICLTMIAQNFKIASSKGTFVTEEFLIYIRKSTIVDVWRTSRMVQWDGQVKETEIHFTRITADKQYDVKETPEEIFSKEK